MRAAQLWGIRAIGVVDEALRQLDVEEFSAPYVFAEIDLCEWRNTFPKVSFNPIVKPS